MEHDLATGSLWWYGAFLLSTVCHEASHAWVASRLGDDTALRGGQVTLNLVPHIRREPIGMVVVPILSWFVGGWIFGWASAPYSVEWAQEHPKKAAVMALAGPATNLALALTAALLIRLGYEWNVFAAPESFTMSSLTIAPGGGLSALGAQILSIFLSLNLLLCLFNMIPLPPLDGSNAPLLLPAAGRRRQILRGAPPSRAALHRHFVRLPADIAHFAATAPHGHPSAIFMSPMKKRFPLARLLCLAAAFLAGGRLLHADPTPEDPAARLLERQRLANTLICWTGEITLWRDGLAKRSLLRELHVPEPGGFRHAALQDLAQPAP